MRQGIRRKRELLQHNVLYVVVIVVSYSPQPRTATVPAARTSFDSHSIIVSGSRIYFKRELRNRFGKTRVSGKNPKSEDDTAEHRVAESLPHTFATLEFICKPPVSGFTAVGAEDIILPTIFNATDHCVV
jgi:hypothetical protein